MKAKLPLFLFTLLIAASSQAQMYKWVDANGRVHYSDIPPPSSIKQTQMKSANVGYETEAELPYSVATVSRDHPVVLYTSTDCVPCNDGRAMLKGRGIPFSERTVTTSRDVTTVKQAGGDGRLPYITIGRNGITGFETGSWNNALTAAGYPESSRLSANYRPQVAQPAAPAQEPGN